MIFILNPILRISQAFLIQQNIFIFVMIYCRNNIFIHTLCYFMLAIVTCTKEIHPWLPSNNSSIATPPVSSFILLTTNFFLIIVIFWLSQIISKVKHFFIIADIFKTYSVPFSYIKFSVSVNDSLCCHIYF